MILGLQLRLDGKRRPTAVGGRSGGSVAAETPPDRTEAVSPAPVLIVEGILALHYAELRALFDFSIYVNAPNQICLNRRIYRDMRERGRTEESVRAQFEATAQPMADLYVIPSSQHASITVEGTEALDWSVEQILQRLHQLGLLHDGHRFSSAGR